jgi:uncharacterized protein
MYRFEVRGKTFAFDEETLVCLSPDPLADRGLVLWEEAGREPDRGRMASALAREFPATAVNEFMSELDSLCTLLAGPAPDDETPRTLRSIDLHVAHSCNLGCRYCFAGQGDYGAEHGLMTDEVAFRGVDMLVESAHEKDRLNIVFFGGEPLVNFPLIQRTVAYVKEHYGDRPFDYATTTNGTLLTGEIADFLAENEFSVLISMDGVGEVQDALRPYKNGRGTSADIERNVEAIRDRLPVGARATITRTNLDMVGGCAAFAEVGFNRVHYAPVSTEDQDLRLDEACVDAVYDQFLALSDQFVECYRTKQPYPFSGFQSTLHQLRNRMPAHHGCGAGKRLLAVTPEGDLYPCHRFVGVEPWKMGTVWTGIDPVMSERFWSLDTSSREDCTACWARSVCGGGCIREAARDDGTFGTVIDPVMCDLRRETTKVTIDLLARLEAERALAGETAGPGAEPASCDTCP